MVRKIVYPVLLLGIVAVTIAGSYRWCNEYANEIVSSTKAYLELISTQERAVVAGTPIYTDFITPARVNELRTYLLPYHLKVSQESGMTPVTSADSIQTYLDAGSLAPVPQNRETLYYFYNVPKERRYLTPQSINGLNAIAARIQQKARQYGNLPPVKIAISSALRPVAYQNDLRGRNANASLVSSHSYGVSFDIFYDDFFVVLPEPETNNSAARQIQNEIRRRMGFMLGDSLRRQFKAILAMTLLDMQREGKIYVILEGRQRCFHVTVLPDSI